MVYRPDSYSARRQERVTRFGLVQLVTVIVGLTVLLVLFKPTATSLVISLALAAVGCWAGLSESRSGRLEMAVPPSGPGAWASRSIFPSAALIGAIVSALIHQQWVVAVADILFFLAGVILGIWIAIMTEKKKPSSLGTR